MSDNALRIVEIVLAGSCFVVAFDRLRQLNWTMARAPFVAIYLAWMLWSAGSIAAAWGGSPPWFSPFGLAGVLFWMMASRERWRAGPPTEVTKPPPYLFERRRFDRRFSFWKRSP